MIKQKNKKNSSRYDVAELLNMLNLKLLICELPDV